MALKSHALTLTLVSGTSWQGRQDFDRRLNSIILSNTSAFTISVTFAESSISPVPIPASTALSLTTFDLYEETILRADFSATAASAPTINILWTEGPSFIVISTRPGKQ